MREPIENEYFNWLCAKVLEPGNSNYVMLLEILHRTEFCVVVHEDSHRAMDGEELRKFFTNETGNEREPEWFNQPVSILEVLVSFADIVCFETDIPTRDCFYEFLVNLHLEEFRQVSQEDIPIIQSILYTFNMRTYDNNGNGGLFPLSQTNNDQRRVELWYQFSEWVIEKGLI